MKCEAISCQIQREHDASFMAKCGYRSGLAVCSSAATNLLQYGWTMTKIRVMRKGGPPRKSRAKK